MSLPLDSQAIQFTVYIRVTAVAAKIKEKNRVRFRSNIPFEA